MENIRMLNARETADLTGLCYTVCLELLKKHGKKIGPRYYISREKLEKLLLDEGDDG